MRKTLLFILLLTATMSFGQGSGEVIITEIHNRPQKPTDAQVTAALSSQPSYWTGPADATNNEGHTEWFEVYNTTASPVVMDGWKLIDASNNGTTTIGSFTLAANSYAMFTGFNIPAAQGGITADYIYDYKKPSLNNESTYSGGSATNCPDGIIITDAADNLIDQVLYDYGYGSYIVGGVSNCSNNPGTTALGIPASGSASAVSFMLKVSAPLTAAGNDIASNWEYSTLTYDGSQKGTPGKANDQDATLSTSNRIIEGLKVYPNPAKDYLIIESNKTKISSIEMYNVLGAKVLSNKVFVDSKLNVSRLSKGIYMLKINAEGASTTKKIVIE
ncbi:putative secreted protein (Por secretion system target) [Mariniflexile fucanivorans]|uniref:Putative secreted protein (Por secretion system target) n=1 Tax=Mariniflexile fucanivorans TaxID=264023 RepID=A0A4R1RAU3_9FLAO|nr:T9SS type A sorting domain-containing protein [Mariniflexile fucanivorans]TCL62838.1 putative secreted protein (Por secretion system target) [Mariniflexile fucanivorans]